MPPREVILESANKIFGKFNAEIVRTRESHWNRCFQRWIEEAKAAGKDPNDVGDVEWASDELADGLELYYLPIASKGTKIVELGPGSGRLTRHLVAAGADVTVVDRSKFVCEWITSYLPVVKVQQTEGCRLPVPSGTADAFFAHGVFEHLLAEEAYWFLVEVARVLKPGGKVVFNFDNIASPGGLESMENTSSPDDTSMFIFHHPDAITGIAKRAGFDHVDIKTSETRTAFALLTR